MTESPQAREFRLSLQKYAQQLTIDNELYVNFTEREDPLRDHCALIVVRGLMGIEHDDELSVPRSWWDHVKRDLLPAWIRRHLAPVAYTRYRAVSLLPDYPLPERYGRRFTRLSRIYEETLDA